MDKTALRFFKIDGAGKADPAATASPGYWADDVMMANGLTVSNFLFYYITVLCVVSMDSPNMVLSSDNRTQKSYPRLIYYHEKGNH